MDGQDVRALVTGADSGIGLCYARELARTGRDLVVVSNRQREIDETARLLGDEFGVRVAPVCLDLSKDDAAQRLFDFCRENGFQVEVLVNNAGVFSFNRVVETSPALVDLTVGLHVRTVVLLCRLFGAEMAACGKGHILNMSSLSAWMSLPGIALYQASKVYVRNFSRSLWYELKKEGVGVTVVCPGAVDTALYGLSPKLRRLGVRLGILMPPEKLVRRALRRMYRGKRQYIPGWINRVFIPVIAVLPDSLIFWIEKKLRKYEK